MEKIHEDSLSQIVRDLRKSVKGLLQSEVELIKAEAKDTVADLEQASRQAALFVGLLLMSALPFLAFLVIGLGVLLNGNYWLSSLILSAFCALFSGTLSLRAYRTLKSHDLSLPRSRQSLRQETATLGEKIEEIQETTKQETRIAA